MKKITFRRCTVMAAVFAACLFAAGCKPNQPNPAPNPEPAPSPAPSPAPNPAPAPSLEVPMPNEPSVTPGGGTVQEQTIPNPYPPAVETVNVPLVLKSVARPTAAGEYYGVAPRYAKADGTPKAVNIWVAIPKSIKDKATERQAAVRKQLLAKLKADYNAEYEFYATASGTGIPSFADGTDVFVGQSETTMKIDTKVVLDSLTAGEAATNPTYYKVKSFPSFGKRVTLLGTNTEPTSAITGQRIKDKVEAILTKEFDGSSNYQVYTTAGPGATAAVASDYSTAYSGTADVKFYVGKKLVSIVKSFTVKSINNTIVGPPAVNPILDEPWTIATTSSDALNLSYDTTGVNSKLQAHLRSVTGESTATYNFYADAAGSTPLIGEHLETLDVIYVGKQ